MNMGEKQAFPRSKRKEGHTMQHSFDTAQAQVQSRQEDLLRLFTALLKQDRVHSVSETEPWGTLIATEAKHNETRTWPARLSYNGPWYRGPLAIHLSKRMDDAICYEQPFRDALQAAGYQPDPHHPRGNAWGLPLGHVIAVAWLESVWQVSAHTAHRIPNPESAEYAFGNYQEGRFIWTFSCAYRLSSPIPVLRGAPGIWKWIPPDQFWNEIQAQLDQLRLQLDNK